MIFKARNWKIVLQELIVLAKKTRLHTMIRVIDAENQSSVFS
jgi:L-amino acid N-acyltransferase YncA